MIKKKMRGMYQIYFYVNLFNPLDNSSILSEENLNKRMIYWKLLNEVLSPGQEYESRIEVFAQENNISRN